jgi:hypothetical protein
MPVAVTPALCGTALPASLIPAWLTPARTSRGLLDALCGLMAAICAHAVSTQPAAKIRSAVNQLQQRSEALRGTGVDGVCLILLDSARCSLLRFCYLASSICARYEHWP